MEGLAICWSLGHRLAESLIKVGQCPDEPAYRDNRFKTILGWWILRFYVSCDLNELEESITCKHLRHGANHHI